MVLKNTTVNKQSLTRGIQNWFNYPNWPHDFHSQLYVDLNQILSNGITLSGWDYLVDTLSDWRANRPKTKDFIRLRGITVHEQLNHHFEQIRNRNITPSISTVDWPDVSPLFEVAGDIKGVSSPVFSSKLCHFLMPNVFPVIDNEFIGVNGLYKDYWLSSKRIWDSLGDGTKNELIDELSGYIPASNRSLFPWATKIVELCYSAK